MAAGSERRCESRSRRVTINTSRWVFRGLLHAHQVSRRKSRCWPLVLDAMFSVFHGTDQLGLYVGVDSYVYDLSGALSG